MGKNKKRAAALQRPLIESIFADILKHHYKLLAEIYQETNIETKKMKINSFAKVLEVFSGNDLYN